MADQSTIALLDERVAQDPAARLIAIPDPFGSWFDLTAQEFGDRVRALAKGLVAAGLHSGDRLGVLCSTRFEATLVDAASALVGVATVPVDRGAAQSEILAVLDDAGVTAMIVETPADFARFDELHSELPGVLDVWQIGLGALDKLVDAGRGVSDDDLAARASTVEPSTTAGLLYTVEAGEPSHVVVTQGVLAARARELAAALGEAMGPERSLVQVLPATDPSARPVALAALLTGTRLGHLHESSDLIATLHSFRPTLLVAGPETFARIDEAARDRSEASGRGTAFRQAHDVALEYASALARGPVPMGLRTRFAVADTLILRSLRRSVGGRVTHAVSIASTATLPERLRLLMLALDVRPLEAFGRPDTGGIVAIERPDDPFARPPGTVGAPLPGVEVAVAADGGIALRGPGVTGSAGSGDGDGWLASGLVGELIDGRLVLAERDFDEVPAPAAPADRERPGSDVAADF